MRLPTYTDYTLRALMYLAVNGDRLAPIADIASAYGISEAHITKVVHRLGVAGEVETVRGRNGGIRLRKSPDQINIGAIIRRAEPDLYLVPCFEDDQCCTIGQSCVLKHALADAMQAFLAVLDRYTLADLVRPRAQLAALFRFPPEPAPPPAGAQTGP
jgi:Rrf2 family nitric oxide-sensitive transcriptional repressor